MVQPKTETERIENIPLSKIKLDLWDARKKDDDESTIDSIAISIKNLKLFTPIRVSPPDKHGFYSVIMGRRRYKAFKKLGRHEIPCIVEQTTDIKKFNRMTLAENLMRENLTDREKIDGILHIFKQIGFDRADVLFYAKACHNDINSPTIPVEFKEAIADLSHKANFIYQLMQLVTPEQMLPEVFDYAEQMKLSTSHKIMLTHTALRAHPTLQKILIDRIKNMRLDEARIEVRQMIHDIKTGGIKKSGKSYWYDEAVRERLEDIKMENENHPFRLYLDLMKTSNKIIQTVTGHRLARGEYKYDPKHIKYTRQKRTELVNDLSYMQLRSLENNLEVAYLGIKEMLEMIDTRLNKEDMRKNERDR